VLVVCLGLLSMWMCLLVGDQCGCVGWLVINVDVLVGDQCGCVGWLVINVDVLEKRTNSPLSQR